MKIVIHANNVLNHSDIKSFISKIPFSWRKSFNTITVNTAIGDQILMSYHREKEKFGIHIPDNYKGTSTDALVEVAITVQAIKEYGYIPDRIKPSRVKMYQRNWNDVCSAI